MSPESRDEKPLMVVIIDEVPLRLTSERLEQALREGRQVTRPGDWIATLLGRCTQRPSAVPPRQ